MQINYENAPYGQTVGGVFLALQRRQMFLKLRQILSDGKKLQYLQNSFIKNKN